jgi:hypothetical protein
MTVLLVLVVISAAVYVAATDPAMALSVAGYFILLAILVLTLFGKRL